jgi:hypothetical protein
MLGGFVAPQRGHLNGSAAPHCLQKRLLSELSARQVKHSIT